MRYWISSAHFGVVFRLQKCVPSVTAVCVCGLELVACLTTPLSTYIRLLLPFLSVVYNTVVVATIDMLL